MTENKTKTRLRAGKPVFGVISPTTDPIIAEYCGLLGLDYYMIDGEHGAISPSDITNLIRACERRDITPLARIRSVDPKLILQFFDAGLMGVMMPSIKTVADVQQLVQAVKYPPLGERGLGPVRAADYMLGSRSQEDYVNYANEQTLVLPQIEDIECIKNLPEMVKVKGVDGFIIGPRDLAMSMGYYDGPAHDEVKQAIDEAFKIVLEAGLIIGTVAGTAEQAQALIDKGATIILNSVSGLLKQSVKSFLAARD